MGSLKLVVAAVVLLAGAAAEAQDIERWRGHIAEASVRFGIPEAWIERVMRAESGGRTTLGGRPVTSGAGAMGLMQLMPGTWSAMRTRHHLGSDPHDPRDNILAGTAYLRMMYDRFGYPGLFGAYNAGPARYAAHVERGRPLPAETITYLARVAGPDAPAVPATPRDGRGSIFVIRRPSGKDVMEAVPEPADELFVMRAAMPGQPDAVQ